MNDIDTSDGKQGHKLDDWLADVENAAAIVEEDRVVVAKGTRLVEFPKKHQKNPSGTKPTLINMVKAVTTRSGTRKILTNKETEKPQPMEPILDNDTTSNNSHNNPKDTSIKEMQSTDPFCKHIVKRLLNKTAPEHDMKTFFIHNGLLYRYASDHSKDFCALVIPKA